MHDDDKIPMGMRVKDRVTGFEGRILGRSEFLYASDTVLVHSEELIDGRPGPAIWFEAGRIQRADPETAGPPVRAVRKEAE